MDFFQARYMSAAQGRFTSIDPSYEGEVLEYPQTWNRYAYVYNKPLSLTDADGRCPPCLGAAVGGVIEGGISLFGQLASNNWDIHQVSWTEVGSNFAGGAVTGALAASTLGGTLLLDVAAGSLSSVAGGIVNRSIASITYDPTADPFGGTELLADTLSGTAGGLIGHGVAHVAADMIDAPVVGPYPQKGRNFAKRLAGYNTRNAAQESREVKAFGYGTAASTPIVHNLNVGLNYGPGHMFDWLDLLFSSLSRPTVSSQICYPDTNGNLVCQ